MELSLSLDAREVLFHLNYMGYRNISKEQLKSFMIGKKFDEIPWLKAILKYPCVMLINLLVDLKKLIKYESQPQKTTSEVNFQAGPHSINIQRLFESHTATSKSKQREKHSCTEKAKNKEHICKPKVHPKEPIREEKKAPKSSNPKKSTSDNHNKENIPAKCDSNQHPKEQINRPLSEKEPAKSKMWIRPKSAQSTKQMNPKKRNDPVALYQEYQKDWEKFRSNICESSRSELRWTIREKLLANH